MGQEALLTRVQGAARELDTLIADIRGFTYVDLKALDTAERHAYLMLMLLTLAAQGDVHESTRPVA